MKQNSFWGLFLGWMLALASAPLSAQELVKDQPELSRPISDKKLVIAHCMTNIIRFKGHKLEDSCDPDYYEPKGNITGPLGGLTQVKVLSDSLLREKSLDEAVEFEMRTAIQSGIDGFQFYYVLGTPDWDEIIKAYFRVADRQQLDFKLTLCISHPSGSTESARIAELARRINGILEAVGRNNPHWLRTPDGRLILYMWYGEQLADIPADKKGLPEAYYMARAYKRLGEATGERFACVYSINERIDPKKLDEVLDYFPAVWMWTVSYTQDYAGKPVADRCRERGRTFMGSAFSDFYTSKLLKRGTWDMFHYANEAVAAGIGKVERKYIATGLSWTFRQMLEFGIARDVSVMNIITWNDYPEGHHLAPELNHNDGFSLLLKYYKSIWKKEPSPFHDQDIAIAFFKKYPHDAIPRPYNIPVVSFQEDAVPGKAEDSIEVVTILPRTAQLVINGKSKQVPAGLVISRVPMQEGPVKVAIVREGVTVKQFTTPEKITRKPYRTDRLTYSWSTETGQYLQSILKEGTTEAAAAPSPLTVIMDKVKLDVALDAGGTPTYALQYDRQPVIKTSRLGFSLTDDSTFDRGFELVNTARRSVNETWQPVWGEVKTIRDQYEELTLFLRQRKAPQRLLNIVFRVFADGVGFRYEFPRQPQLKYFVVADERTQFNLTGDHTAWWIPGDYDTNEYLYTTSALSKVDNTNMVSTSTDIAVRTAPDPYAVQTPLMLKSREGLYINIHEAALVNYPAMQLHVDRSDFSLSSSLVPDATGNKAYLHAPGKTPWRTVIVSNKAAEILASKLILNLNDPTTLTNTDWIKPMKFVGVWWEMQTGKATWNYSNFPDSVDAQDKLVPNGTHGANTANVKKYIDFAAANGILGVLVEGWNTGWEDWFGNWKENVFSFTTPYPDFDVQEIRRYAAARGVKMIMHNETSGSATDYERQLDTAFRFMNLMGYPSVKTGYVGKIIPRGEHHDGQWMVNHYERVARKAAGHQVTIDVHEPMRPTGQHRTWPNWLASEAGRGNEYNAFSIGSPPEHETILPFTRLIGGPMDYTPGIFKMKGYASHAPDRQMHTTLAKQLALYVTIYSPVQMAADLPENYLARPDAFQFIKDVPVDWDDTKIIEAEPGDYVTIARKEKGKASWYVGAITDENSRIATVPLDFLDKGQSYVAVIYGDAPGADWKANPEAYQINSFLVDGTTVLKLKLAPGGGAAVQVRPATTTELKQLKKYKSTSSSR